MIATPEEEYKWSLTQTKVCSKCYKTLNLTCFNGNTSGSDPFNKYGYRLRRPECSECTKIGQKSKNIAIRKAKHDGINIKPPPNTSCEICSKDRNIVFDHDHKNNTFRGWICNECNRSIGMIGENIEDHIKVINYLNKFEQKELSFQNGKLFL